MHATKTPNALIHETSPYLLQHAYNPVQWQPWGEAALAQARKQNKLILVSIGYSACHWCHVMERESFEDPAVAALMNEHFVCIKVDREERPDVDQIYMDAVQLMRGQGGWPLNCFTLPDGRPIYGGTYFKREQFMQVLQDLAAFYQTNPVKAEEYAANLTGAIRDMEKVVHNGEAEASAFSTDDLIRIYHTWAQQFDTMQGGTGHAPKFPVPCAWQFLLRYAHHSGNTDAMRQLELTLEKMALGGLYDQLGGGFARYSVDAEWFAPHFEKMLYDNAQLVSLYADAYRKTGNVLYRQVIEETLAFVERELTHPTGGFYSALDADSPNAQGEGEEGFFYTWTEQEIDVLLGAKAGLFKAYYNITPQGNWEHGRNVLHHTRSATTLALELGIGEEQFQAELAEAKSVLMEARAQRPRPGLDDKILTGWNGLMCKAYVDAYRALGNTHYLSAAKRSMAFIESKLADAAMPERLHRTWKDDATGGRAAINAYLEDYAHVLDAQLALYQATLDEQYLHNAQERLEYVIRYFYDERSGLFYFTSTADAPLIARKTEYYDSVLPSSNSTLAHVLLTLYHLLDQERYHALAQRMLRAVQPLLGRHGSGFLHWANLLARFVLPDRVVAVAGPQALAYVQQMAAHYHPDALFAGTPDGTSTLPLLQHKHVQGQTTVYVCQHKTCKLPVTTPAAALQQLAGSA